VAERALGDAAARMPRQLRAGRQDAQILLLGEDLLAVSVPTGVELAFVLGGPFLRHMVRRMHCACAEVHDWT
jgi:hypothetical protein